MKGSEVAELTELELTARLEETQRELFNLRVQAAIGALENTARVRALRRDVARLRSEETKRNKTAAN
ncbi:MAG TPA: 50S ribosomal protein L29 [Lentisphaeria bacterium]|nr:50S ribosomal protein L29 [Lentisphaeria bacterium]